ncbi:MAG: phospho-N-acetylmuramoyl-pentapeptide-transferase [Rhabdochlamydiaceae bacterium]|nr:phospho-N-acetylmuramoyl-pentapeptide-transferase [Rhabdochlamydiaceae bacterium]
MLLFLFGFLQKAFSLQIPSAFFYSSTRMILAAFTSLFFILFLGPWFIRKLSSLKASNSIRVEDCPPLAELHKKKKDTPTMGGILILSSMLVSLFLWMDLHAIFTWILFLTTIWIGGIGAYDDYLKLKYKNSKGLRARKKMLLQGVFALLLALYLLVPSISQSLSRGNWLAAPIAKQQIFVEGKEEIQTLSLSDYSCRYYMPFCKDPVFILKGGAILLGFLLTWFVVTGSSNAVNLTDGLDGLASGCLIMVAAVMAIVAFFSNNIELSSYLNILYIEGSGEIAIYLFALVGACLGFLWFNGSPAEIFMGDTGSLTLGAILGVSSILLRREFLFALTGGIFIAETLSVILQVGRYKMCRKRVFLCAPLHHHFEYKGWPETKVVLRFWIISLLLCLLGVVSLKLQ